MCLHVDLLYNWANEDEVFVTDVPNKTYTIPTDEGDKIKPDLTYQQFFNESKGFITKFYKKKYNDLAMRDMYCIKDNKFADFLDGEVKEGDHLSITLMFNDLKNNSCE